MLKNFVISVILLVLNISLRNCDVKVIAHRGASAYLPEHTLEAKLAAILMKADYVEQDVVLTKDNIPVIIHDIHLDEVTNVAEKYPERFRMLKGQKRYYAIDFTFDEMKSLKATERFQIKNKENPVYPKRFPIWQSSFQLHSLEEEIQFVQGFEKSTKQSDTPRKVGIYVELKRPDFHYKENRNNFSEIVLDILSKYNYKTKEDACIIQCFDPFELKRIRKELKSSLTLVQLLQEPGKDDEGINQIDYDYWNSRKGLENITTFADGIGPEKGQLILYDKKSGRVTPSDLYQNAKNLGLFIHPYTFRADRLPNYASDYTQLLKIFIQDLKIDGLFTDFTDLTVNFKNNSAKAKSSISLIIMAIGYLFLKNVFF